MSSASFSNPYIASPTSQLILQQFRRFTYVTAHSTALPLLHLRHLANRPCPYEWRMSQCLILQPLHRFTYVTAHSPTLRRFTYITDHSTTLPLLHLHHRHFTFFTWRAAHVQGMEKLSVVDQLVTASYFQKQLQFCIVVKNFTTSSTLIFLQASPIVSSDSYLNIHNALYFVKYPSRATQNSPEGRRPRVVDP